jgi:alpha-amylase/alpha-mannosidase (GH57 family)
MSSKIYVQFLWHFHQPYYSVPNQTTNKLPWVRLHSIKSYYDMGRMLERFPQVRSVVNFSGCLLQQLREYIEEGKRDSWWELTEKPASELTKTDKTHLLHNFFSIDWDTCVERYPRYQELLDKRGHDDGAIVPGDFSVQELRDLQVLFNLAWFGFSARDERAVVQALVEKGRSFTEGEKQALLEQQIEIMQLLAPLYNKLHHRGQIELSITPMYHPILPLIIDSDSAKVATPNRPRPNRLQAERDAHFHVDEARTVARDVLGVDVNGMWPAEGSISPEAIDVFNAHDVEWIASDEEVLQKSIGERWSRQWDLYHPWHLQGSPQTQIFFRDRGLSDLIGFVYSKQDAKEAVDDFLGRIRSIGAQRREDAAAPVISIILDGENPWEHYPGDGEAFLEELYGALSDADDIDTVTPTQYLDEVGPGPALERLHSGSWIEANYRIWIGEEQTNHAWDLLGRAREHLERRVEEDSLSDDRIHQAWEALYIAQGSDWFWWYGDDFTSHNDTDFDRLFRDLLRHVYAALGDEPPADLNVSIVGSGSAQFEFSAPQSLIQPTIDGNSDYFYEWSGAGVYRHQGGHGSMFESTSIIEELRVGFDLGFFYLMAKPGPDFRARRDDLSLKLKISGPSGVMRIIDVELGDQVRAVVDTPDRRQQRVTRVAYVNCLELAVPFADLDLATGDDFSIYLSVLESSMEIERHPHERTIALSVPDETFELRNWIV